jgi:hypothetical protein
MCYELRWRQAYLELGRKESGEIVELTQELCWGGGAKNVCSKWFRRSLGFLGMCVEDRIYSRIKLHSKKEVEDLKK